MKITQQQLRQIIKEEAEAHYAETHGRGGKHHGMGAGHSNRMRLDRMPALGEPDPELAYDEDAAGMMAKQDADPEFDADFYMDSEYDIEEAAEEADEMYDVDLDEAAEEDEGGALHEKEDEDEGAMHEGEAEEDAAAEGLNESRWGKLAGLKG